VALPAQVVTVSLLCEVAHPRKCINVQINENRYNRKSFICFFVYSLHKEHKMKCIWKVMSLVCKAL
jgi:hypothetical protein